jgi:hypothetical protein
LVANQRRQKFRRLRRIFGKKSPQAMAVLRFLTTKIGEGRGPDFAMHCLRV